MRLAALALALLLAPGLVPAESATQLSDVEMDHVSAGGYLPYASAYFPDFSQFVAPVVFTVPTNFVNIPVNVNTIVDTMITVNVPVAFCGYCPGATTGPTAVAENPVNKAVFINIPQTNTFAPINSVVPNIQVGSMLPPVVPPPFAFPTVATPTMALPALTLPTLVTPAVRLP